MQRVLLYLLGIALLILVNNLLNSCMHQLRWEEFTDTQRQATTISCQDRGSKVILMGSSTTKSGYASEEIVTELGLGKNEFLNLATMPNNPEINLQIIKRFAGQLKGSVVLYGLDPWIFSEYYYQHFNNKLSRWTLLQRLKYIKLAKPKFGKVIDALNGGNLFSNLQQRIISQTDNPVADEAKDRDWLGKDPMANIAYTKWFNYPDFGLSEDFMNALSSLDGFCHEQGCKLVIYIPGYSRDFIQSYKGVGFHELLVSQIKHDVKYAETDLTLLDMDDELFWDGIHVKPKGKALQTDRIVRMIRYYVTDQE